MPHAPRWQDGRLYALNSGTSLLQAVDLATGARQATAGDTVASLELTSDLEEIWIVPSTPSAIS